LTVSEGHRALDVAVAVAYGWVDLDAATLDHGHHATSFGVRWASTPPMQREIERRLLELNLVRAAATSWVPINSGSSRRGPA